MVGLENPDLRDNPFHLPPYTDFSWEGSGPSAPVVFVVCACAVARIGACAHGLGSMYLQFCARDFLRAAVIVVLSYFACVHELSVCYGLYVAMI